MRVETDLPNDPVLPQLQTVLDLAAMRKILQAHLFDETTRFKIKSCEIERVKYKPGKNCMFCYQIQIFDATTEQTERQKFCLRIYECDASATRFKKALSEPLVSPLFGRALTHIPELEMLVWAFPNDRKLRGLPMIADTKTLQETILPELLKRSLHQDWHIEALSSEVIHYVPEHTCTVRTTLNLAEKRTNNKKTMTLYGKTYYNEDGREVDEMMRQLWRSECRHSGALGMAEALGYHEASKTFWQYALPGKPLLDYDMDTQNFLLLLEKTGSVVSALHQSPLKTSRCIVMDDWLLKLSETCQLVIKRKPQCQSKLKPLVARLLLQFKTLKILPEGTLHGDLHLNNFLVADQNISLIDMDNMSRGPRLLDIGSFLAGLFYRGLLFHHSLNQVEKIGKAFLQGYQASAESNVPRFDLAWYTATALINERVFRCMSRVKAGRLDILDDLIDLADRISLGKVIFLNTTIMDRKDPA